MSMVAAKLTPNVAVAQTLCSLAPVLIVPVAYLVYKERMTSRSMLGALLAVAGAAMLVSMSAEADPGPDDAEPEVPAAILPAEPEPPSR